MRRLPIALAIFVAVVACGTQQAAKPAGPAAYQLYAAGGSSILVFDARTGDMVRELPAGVPSPDWSVLYTATPARGQTLLKAIDARTGSALRSLSVNGQYALLQPDTGPLPGGLSPDGKWLALAAPPDATSRLLVVETAFRSAPKAVNLEGDFRFDAISNDGSALYLLQYVAPGRYSVRLYDLAAGRLSPTVIADKREPVEPMQGSRLTSVDSPAGDHHYGLYLRSDATPFVHALPLNRDEPFAWCVDLPVPASLPSATDWSLTQSAGGRLYAASGVLGMVVEIMPGDPPSVGRTLRLPAASSRGPWPWTDAFAKEAGGSPGAVVSADQRTLYFPGRQGIAGVDITHMLAIRSWFPDTSFGGVVATRDGKRLLALGDGLRLYEIDLSTGAGSTGTYLHPPSPLGGLALLTVTASG
jgi:hypothetical protein